MDKDDSIDGREKKKRRVESRFDEKMRKLRKEYKTTKKQPRSKKKKSKM